MNVTLAPGARCGAVKIPASKSQAHRLLICAALGTGKTEVVCDGTSNDIAATVRCLRALGAGIEEAEEAFRVTPIAAVPEGVCELPCGESGSTLRFLLPVVGALGARATFRREGRLPQRPLAPLDALLTERGMRLTDESAALRCEGRLRPGEYRIAGNVSSQYISGLLLALPLLPEESAITVTGTLESAGYVAMTEEALRRSGVRFAKQGARTVIPGGQRFVPPARVRVEGDWSNAAFFLCMGALSARGVRVEGLSADSAQGDRAVLDVLRRFGARTEESAAGVSVHRGTLTGCTIDAAPIPDLIPALSVVAAAAAGETRITGARRLRLKESDRLATTARMLAALGADVTEEAEGLTVRGRPCLTGGTVEAENDHRIAMAAALAACACTAPVTVRGAECTAKSYPAFWKDFGALEEECAWRST